MPPLRIRVQHFRMDIRVNVPLAGMTILASIQRFQIIKMSKYRRHSPPDRLTITRFSLCMSSLPAYCGSGCGELAQLVERYDGIVEVRGSTPLFSTNKKSGLNAAFFIRRVRKIFRKNILTAQAKPSCRQTVRSQQARIPLLFSPLSCSNKISGLNHCLQLFDTFRV